MTLRRALAVVTLPALVALAQPGGIAQAANYLDDACPDRGGTALVVDTAAKAAILANGFNLPACDVTLRVGLDPAGITSPTLRLRARSFTLHGAVEIVHPMKDSVLVLEAEGGDIVVGDARLAAGDTLQLECRPLPGCTVQIQKGARLQARRIRTISGRVSVEEATLVGGDLDLRTGSLR